MSKNKMSKKELLKARKEAYKIFLYADAVNVRFSRIAEETGLTIEQVKHYKEKDKWKERKEKDIKNKVRDDKVKEELNHILYEPETVHDYGKLEKILDESGLRDQQKLFLMYYLQSYNAKQAAMQSGYSKHSAGTRGNLQLKDPRVAETLNKIKALMHESINITTHNIIDEYVKIAMADITDYIDFEGDRVTLKSSTKVDGTLITEVKQGRDGISIKLADKMKALERLEKLFEIMPDRRLELEEKKFELQKQLADGVNGEDNKVTIINDIG